VLRYIFILGLAVAAHTYPAQAPETELSSPPFKLTATAEFVLLDVSVKDVAGEHMANLGKDNFRIYEGGSCRRSLTLPTTTSRSPWA
jgi:hypothetical protein